MSAVPDWVHAGMDPDPAKNTMLLLGAQAGRELARQIHGGAHNGASTRDLARYQAVAFAWRLRIESAGRPGSTADHGLGVLAAFRDELNREMDEAVKDARQSGASWAVIGNALGITRQAAHERYGKQQKAKQQVQGQAALEFSNE